MNRGHVSYTHTQIGGVVLAAVVMMVALFSVILQQTGFHVGLAILMLIVLGIPLSFSTLSVAIDDECMKIVFGWGIYKKQFALRDVESAQCVKNRWYYGWGIRAWFKPFVIIYSVSGFDAVELKMKDGSLYRIGTDEPVILKNAIESTIV